MNADKLIKIAKILDEKNLYALADKVDKIAQNANPNAGESWNKRLYRVFSGNATEYDYPGAHQLGNFMRKNVDGYKNRLIRERQQQNQPQQPQNALLVSTTPQQFVQNLFQFGKQNNLGTLAQTMDMYSKQGGTYNSQPINQNQQTLNLYNQIKNYSGILTPQQILSMLTGTGQ